jgi:hypothetical protein
MEGDWFHLYSYREFQNSDQLTSVVCLIETIFRLQPIVVVNTLSWSINMTCFSTSINYITITTNMCVGAFLKKCISAN